MATNNLTEIQRKIAELQQQEQELIKKEKESVIAGILEKINTYGITAQELGFSNSKAIKSQAKARTKSPAKYQKDGNEWTGRGRKPKWVQELISKDGVQALEKYRA